MRILIELPKGVYERTSPITKEHRKHLSIAIKAWWDVPENKERMREAQTGIIRPSTPEANMRKSIALKRYYRNKRKSGKEVGG